MDIFFVLVLCCYKFTLNKRLKTFSKTFNNIFVHPHLTTETLY